MKKLIVWNTFAIGIVIHDLYVNKVPFIFNHSFQGKRRSTTTIQVIAEVKNSLRR